MKIKHVILPYHRQKHKYKEYHNMENIVVGKGELPFIPKLNGWRTLDGSIITSRDEAIAYATVLDKKYQQYYQHKMQSNCRFDKFQSTK